MRGEWRLVKYRGTWCAYSRQGGHPIRSSLRTTDRQQAEAAFATFLASLVKRPEAATVGQIVDGYIAGLAEGSSARTRQEMTLKAIKKVRSPNLLILSPASITDDVCRDYAKARRVQGKSDGTIRADLGLLRTAFNWAAEQNWIQKAPPVEMPPPPPAKDRWLSSEEAGKLLAAADLPHIRLFVLLALHTAARTAAILELTWDRVNERFIDLNPAGRAKTRKGRAVVPMNPTLWEALSEARQGALTDFVIEWAGEPVKRVKRSFKRAAERAKLDDVTPHTLRHTAATWMVQAGVPLQKVAAFLGHSNTRMVEQVYGHHAPDYLKTAGGAIVERLHRVGPPGSNEPPSRERKSKTGRK